MSKVFMAQPPLPLRVIDSGLPKPSRTIVVVCCSVWPFAEIIFTGLSVLGVSNT